MAASLFTRFINVRNIINVNNFGASGCTPNVVQFSNTISKSYCTTNQVVISNDEPQKDKKISKAMKAYLEKTFEYKKFIEKEIAEYNIGKRHLANMMGEDPENFSDKDVNKAIRYLFPSGLYDRRARPIMAHPDTLYKNRKEAEFDDQGKPYHFLFYTTRPNYYELLYKIAESMINLNKIEDDTIAGKITHTQDEKVNLIGSEWLKKNQVEEKLLETISLKQYEYLIHSMYRLAIHPFSKHVSSLIMNYRTQLKTMVSDLKLPSLQCDSNNRPFIIIQNCKRKTARCDVKVIGNGSGNITINGQDITYFSDIQCREQVRKNPTQLFCFYKTFKVR